MKINSLLKRCFFPLTAALALAAVSCSEESKEETYPDLSLSEEKLEMKAGETAEVKILSGSGEYLVSVDNLTVAEAYLGQNNVIAVKGLDSGNAVVTVKDNKSGKTAEVSVSVTKVVLTLEWTKAERWFSGEVPAEADNVKYKSDEVSGIEKKSYYNVTFGTVPTQMTAVSLNEESWNYTINIEDSKAVDVFKEALKAFNESADYTYYHGESWNQNVTGENRVEINKEDVQSSVDNADFTSKNMRFGYRRDGAAVAVGIENGAFYLDIRPMVFKDNWRWYAENLIGNAFPQMLNDYYFVLKSSGVIPLENKQLLVFSAKDKSEIEFNLTCFAPLFTENPCIEKIEGSYELPIDKAMARWEEIMKMSQEEIGEFEQALVYPLDNSQKPTTLSSSEEVIKYVKEHDIKSYDSVMPIFRLSDHLVIVPQLDQRLGLSMIMAKLEKEK